MASIFTRNGAIISLERDLIVGEGDNAITIPAGSLQDAATREEWGIVETIVPDTVREDERFFWITDNGDGTFTNQPKSLDILRPWAVAEVKRQRQIALDAFPKSSGVAEIYAENIAAALAHRNGTGAVIIMRDGSTAADYLAAMASGMGASVEQFVEFVLAENVGAAIKAREVEAEYVRLVYSLIPNCTFDQVRTVVTDYQAFCEARRPE